MSSKQKSWIKYQQAQQRDSQLCADCGHKRIEHLAEGECAECRRSQAFKCPAFREPKVS